MSAFGGVPPEISALQSVQAQREAAKARDRTRAALERGRSAAEEEERFRVHDTSEIADVRRLEEESEGEDERSRQRRERHHADQAADRRASDPDKEAHLDITA